MMIQRQDDSAPRYSHDTVAWCFIYSVNHAGEITCWCNVLPVKEHAGVSFCRSIMPVKCFHGETCVIHGRMVDHMFIMC